ncbi:MAG: hypothetical protein CME15_11885 [Gemmatimonadetes bacterium]|jgi:hypothetical protein|nr:hypothetical protein [Gemmatimonadota bacterium]
MFTPTSAPNWRSLLFEESKLAELLTQRRMSRPREGEGGDQIPLPDEEANAFAVVSKEYS